MEERQLEEREAGVLENFATRYVVVAQQ